METQSVPPIDPDIQKKKKTKTIWIVVIASFFVCCCPLSIIVAAVVAPVILNAGIQSQVTSSLSRLKMQGSALNMYAADFDDVLPPASLWMDGASPYLEPEALEVPFVGAGSQSFGYAFNAGISSFDLTTIADVTNAPMTFESVLTNRNAAGSSGDVIPPDAADKKVGICFVDGHASREKHPDIGLLNWNPAGQKPVYEGSGGSDDQLIPSEYSDVIFTNEEGGTTNIESIPPSSQQFFVYYKYKANVGDKLDATLYLDWTADGNNIGKINSTSVEVPADPTYTGNFNFTRTTVQEWPIGDYRIDMAINGVHVQTVKFTVR